MWRFYDEDSNREPMTWLGEHQMLMGPSPRKINRYLMQRSKVERKDSEVLCNESGQEAGYIWRLEFSEGANLRVSWWYV